MASWNFDRLSEAGEAVEELVCHPGWVQVVLLLAAEREALDAELDGYRTPKSRAEYAMAHGRRSGLCAAEDAAGALLRHFHGEREKQRRRHETGDASPGRR